MIRLRLPRLRLEQLGQATARDQGDNQYRYSNYNQTDQQHK